MGHVSCVSYNEELKVKCVDNSALLLVLEIEKTAKNKNTWDSNVVPHRSTNQARRCLTSQSRRDAVLSALYGPC